MAVGAEVEYLLCRSRQFPPQETISLRGNGQRIRPFRQKFYAFLGCGGGLIAMTCIVGCLRQKEEKVRALPSRSIVQALGSFERPLVIPQ